MRKRQVGEGRTVMYVVFAEVNKLRMPQRRECGGTPVAVNVAVLLVVVVGVGVGGRVQ